MKKSFLCIIVICTVFMSCHRYKNNLVTYDLQKGDYVEKIQASGMIQAVNNFSIVAPVSWSNKMTVTRLVPMGSFVKKGDTICVLEAKDLQELLETYTEKVKGVKADLAKMEANNDLNTSMLAAEVEKNHAQMEISQLDSIQMKFAPPAKQKILSLELEKSKIEERKLDKKLGSQKTINEAGIRQIKSRIIQAENTVQRIADQIHALTIIAPIDGMVAPSDSPVFTIISSGGGSGTFGGAIKNGSTIYSEMPIVNLPDLREVQVSLEVLENDYKRIEKDQKVRIRVDAANNLITTGVVKKKAMVGKRTQSETKIKVYEVTVSVDSCHLLMTPGLSAECEIIVNQVKDTVVIPTPAIFEKDSIKTVFVFNGRSFTQREIGIGLSNSSETIVTKGLTGNETIALMEPPHNLIEKPLKSIK